MERKINILVLSFYFQPDLCAGSFRSTSLVKQLESMLIQGSQIDLVTTLPNRYNTFSQDAPELENRFGLEIRRIALPPHQSGIVDQSKAFLSFSRQALKHVAKAGIRLSVCHFITIDDRSFGCMDFWEKTSSALS